MSSKGSGMTSKKEIKKQKMNRLALIAAPYKFKINSEAIQATNSRNLRQKKGQIRRKKRSQPRKRRHRTPQRK